jgi:uncharacterized protein
MESVGVSYLPGLSPEALAGLFLVATVAAIIQRTTGQAFGTILAGFVTLIAPAYVPAAVILLGAPVTLMSVGLDFLAVKVREIAPAIVGRLTGAVPAAMLVSVIAGSQLLGLFVGLTILLGVVLSLVGLKVARTPVTLGVAGLASGFFGTLTAVGAAPMSLIYQHEEAKAARATLNFFFLVGVTGSIIALAVEGVIRIADLYLVAALAPAVVLGVVLSGFLAKRMEGHSLRPAALILTTGAAFLLLGRSLW